MGENRTVVRPPDGGWLMLLHGDLVALRVVRALLSTPGLNLVQLERVLSNVAISRVDLRRLLNRLVREKVLEHGPPSTRVVDFDVWETHAEDVQRGWSVNRFIAAALRLELAARDAGTRQKAP